MINESQLSFIMKSETLIWLLLWQQSKAHLKIYQHGFSFPELLICLHILSSLIFSLLAKNQAGTPLSYKQFPRDSYGRNYTDIIEYKSLETCLQDYMISTCVPISK